MEFDKSRCYSAINADELHVGDKVINAQHLGNLKYQVSQKDYRVWTIKEIKEDIYSNRFVTDDGAFPLVYLIERAENCTNCKYESCVSCSIRSKEEKKIYKCKNYVNSCVPKKDKKGKEPPLAMWEQCICELRAEIRSHDEDDTMNYAIAICDALENSMVQFAKNEAIVNIDFEQCFNTKDDDHSEVIVL